VNALFLTCYRWVSEKASVRSCCSIVVPARGRGRVVSDLLQAPCCCWRVSVNALFLTYRRHRKAGVKACTQAGKATVQASCYFEAVGYDLLLAPCFRHAGVKASVRYCCRHAGVNAED
jgi:hypothetical protein